jgi:hypothetical protein
MQLSIALAVIYATATSDSQVYSFVRFASRKWLPLREQSHSIAVVSTKPKQHRAHAGYLSIRDHAVATFSQKTLS